MLFRSRAFIAPNSTTMHVASARLPISTASAEPPGPPDVSVSGVTVALDGGRLVVGQVWDETLADRVAPGDRIVFLGTVDVSRVDPCAVIRGEIRGDKPQMTVERKDGTRVTVPVKRMK